MPEMKHIVGLSGGKDSTAMALWLAEIEPRDYEYICTPTGNELPEMVEHWIKLGKLLGKPIKPITSGRSLAGVIRAENILPNWRMRWCTRMLKIEPFEQYILLNQPCTVYIGIRADETDREGVAYEQMGEITRRFVLQEWGWGIGHVLDYLDRRGIVIPDRTDCAACFFQTLFEWYMLWLNYPDMYEEAVQWEEKTGYTLRSDQRDTWPTSLLHLRRRFINGVIPTQRMKMKDRPRMCSVCAR